MLIADKNYCGREFEHLLAHFGVRLIESVNQTFKGQLSLEQHGGHTPAGVWVRVLQSILALTAAIWHNDPTGQP